MSKDLFVVVGLGATGLSCVKHLAKLGLPIAVTDSRPNPPNLDEFKKAYPDVSLSVGKLDEALLSKASKIVLSPGVSQAEPEIIKQKERGIPIIGDIELFSEKVSAPVIAITGTNAKSTVTTLVGEMAKASNINVQIGGNLGKPALDLLGDKATELFVLELSSYQLETTHSLAPKVAALLNVTPDHMDRYHTMENYFQAKRRIFNHSEIAVYNRDDLLVASADYSTQKKSFAFTLGTPGEFEFGILSTNDQLYLAYQDELIMPIKDLPILGRHYQANALAALAIGHAYGFPQKAMVQTLCQFKGLAHRCQLVRDSAGISWYNDSKGTNVGATLAAIEGLGSEIRGKIILIAGGVGKNADFRPLIPAIEKYVATTVLIGESAPILAEIFNQCTDIEFAKSMDEAVSISAKVAKSGDSVLLSPACASFDMFNNFEHRGQVFVDTVQKLT